MNEKLVMNIVKAGVIGVAGIAAVKVSAYCGEKLAERQQKKLVKKYKETMAKTNEKENNK